ncbi:MAG: ACT domain-containing protein, partial [Actinomycetota bacterium]
EHLAAEMESLNYSDVDTLLAAIGEGHVAARPVAQKVSRFFLDAMSEERLTASARRPHDLQRKGTNVGIHVDGFDDVLVRLSKCCTPVPGDEILGFLTRGRGVSVHRADCANAESFADGQAARLVDVEWDGSAAPTSFRAGVEVTALDRSRLLRDVANALSEQHVNIVACSTHTGGDRIAKMRFEFKLADPSHLESVLRMIKKIDGVYDAYRSVPGRGGGDEEN